jgi:oligopeptide transport system ATP-binding protein
MLLDIRHLQVRYGNEDTETFAVTDATLQLAKGEVLAVVGESGAGKSQAFLAITRLCADGARISGEAYLDSRDLMAMNENELVKIRGHDIGYVFQDAMTALNPYLRIERQMLEVLEQHRPMSQQAALAEIDAMLAAVRIENAARKRKLFPHQLSGGQRQRVMLAMALLGRPRVLIADEPTTALDVTVQLEVLDLLRELHEQFGFGLVVVTHDLGVVARVADRVAVMYGGRVVESATSAEFFADARHPYSQGLLAAAPRLDGGMPRPIPGAPPVLDHLPKGCPFAARCVHVMNVCQQPLPWVEITATHFVACQLEVQHEH